MQVFLVRHLKRFTQQAAGFVILAGKQRRQAFHEVSRGTQRVVRVDGKGISLDSREQIVALRGLALPQANQRQVEHNEDCNRIRCRITASLLRRKLEGTQKKNRCEIWEKRSILHER